MTLPVSTSCGTLLFGVSHQGRGCAVFVRVVRYAVDPAWPDDADPGAGQDANRVRVVLAGGAGAGVGGRVAGEEPQGDPRFQVREDGLAAGPEGVQQCAELADAATRMSTTSSRVRVRARSARVSSRYGVAVRSRCWRSRRYSAITSASPGPGLAPDSTSLSRQVLIAFGLTGTTGCPASSSTSARRPDGHSIATGISPGPPSPASLRTSRSRPAALCAMVKRATTFPDGSMTHTA
jgi:hypothetical protein